MQYRIDRRLVIPVLIIFIALLVRFFPIDTWFDIVLIQQKSSLLKQFVARRYLSAVLIYCAFFSLAVIANLPVTLLLTLVGGYLFGVVYGTLYAVLSATIGSVSLFIVYRHYLYELVQQNYGVRLARLNRELERWGTYYIMILQVLPITPTFVINSLAGLTPLSLWSFTWATALGLIPGTAVYAYFGKRLGDITSVHELMSWPLVLFLVVVALGMVLIVGIQHIMYPRRS